MSEATDRGTRAADTGSGRPPGRPVEHGGRSEVQTRTTAQVQKRRLLRQMGLRVSDFEGPALLYLDQWAKAAAKLQAMDKWVAAHGWLDEKGNAPPFAQIYLTCLNTAGRALDRLVSYVEATEPEPGMVEVLQGHARRLDQERLEKGGGA